MFKHQSWTTPTQCLTITKEVLLKKEKYQNYVLENKNHQRRKILLFEQETFLGYFQTLWIDGLPQ